jgi:hypothetical protein
MEPGHNTGLTSEVVHFSKNIKIKIKHLFLTFEAGKV